jgi:hypothetical protein
MRSVRGWLQRGTEGHVPAWILRERASAAERAEAVLHALVGEPTRTVPAVDRHAAHRIDRQARDVARPLADRAYTWTGALTLRNVLLPVGLAAVPALVNASHPGPAVVANPVLWQLISSWPVSGLLALILPLAALALSRMDPRLPVAVSVYLSPLVASALGVAIAGGGTPILAVAVVWGGLIALLVTAAVIGSRRLFHA